MTLERTIAKHLLDIEAVALRPNDYFTWTSGIKSPIYCDNRIILSYVKARHQVAQQMAEYIKQNYPTVELIAGVATGAIGIGILVAELLNLPFVYVRPEPKKHGRQNQIEGSVSQNQKTVVIEDLISTGMSSINAVKALRDSSLDVLGMVAIFSYAFDISKENFEKENVKLHTLSNYHFLLEKAIEIGYISEKELDTLNQWRISPDKWKQ